MTDENGKAKREPDREAVRATEKAAEERPLGGKYAWRGPWGEEEERFFEIMVREFGEGHGGRDSDL